MHNKILLLTSLIAATPVFAAEPAASPAPAPKPVVPDAALAAYASTEHSVELADGRQLHFTCMGEGSPTVLLTAGGGAWGVDWSKVQPAIARKTRVCAWDRPGTGFSDASKAVQNVANTASDLEAALDRGSFGAPWILVGHSIGSYETLLLADRRAKDVAGMVLVDPSFPDQMAVTARLSPALAKVNQQFVDETVSHFRGCATGLRAQTLTSDSDPNGCLRRSRSFPPALTDALAGLADKASRFDSLTSFFENIDEDAAMVVNARRGYGAMPLVVLSAKQAPDYPPDVAAEALAALPVFHKQWRKSHGELAALSTRGEVREVDASHHIHREKPDVVIEAVGAVVERVRAEAGTARRD